MLIPAILCFLFAVRFVGLAVNVWQTGYSIIWVAFEAIFVIAAAWVAFLLLTV